MKLALRVLHLERLETLAHPSSPMERFQRALNEAAVRLMGKSADRGVALRPGHELRSAAERLRAEWRL